MRTRRVVFVCRSASGEALRCATAISRLENVTLLGICENSDASGPFADVVRVSEVHDPRQLIQAAQRFGSVYRIVTAQETLLAPVAEANAAIGVAAMTPEVVARTLDKSKLKTVLRQAGVATPRDRIIDRAEDAQRFVEEAGLPVVLKPLNGSGALTTFRITTEEQLALILTLIKMPVIAETYVHGQELCFDTVTIANEPQCYSVCCYKPSILDALENPATRWRCIMPRELSAYTEFIIQGQAAVRALRLGNAITHMEGFIDACGPAGFVDATLRPAGARIGPMFGFAHDVDPYRLWARVAVDDAFDGPFERKYAVGTIFLRDPGSGAVEIVAGVQTITEKLNDVIVEARWPGIGDAKAATYTGDGFVTVRHRDEAVVQNALDLIDQTIRINYSSSQPIETGWRDRIDNFRALNKPAWEFEVVK
jgi:ribosomal protein S6-L-glutamate ligase RimK-like protein